MPINKFLRGEGGFFFFLKLTILLLMLVPSSKSVKILYPFFRFGICQDKKKKNARESFYVCFDYEIVAAVNLKALMSIGFISILDWITVLFS